ncbi:MAG TPA: hypothetical protein VGU20_05400 [Stellaceae bacterium]|nr:hypothetical protein [Stellaceae bacterium]
MSCFTTPPPSTSESATSPFSFERESTAVADREMAVHVATAASSRWRDACRARIRAIGGAAMPYFATISLAASRVFSDCAIMFLGQKNPPHVPDGRQIVAVLQSNETQRHASGAETRAATFDEDESD